ncbi:Rust resistance kinase Lr10 [Vitis vinifera]|uniref:Rust resistance kinase Lr10 n=1 Tax=Vitis vinifera TaxID=29760 RepID=A0A438HSS2_VITVI|nr:Rust resistance kinase Lr10 [Vitis vinifera]
MMFREAKLVVLALFHTFFLAICAANGNQTCRPSSCGDIQNISYPFRLKGDPSGCGDPDYELVCENNRTMINSRNGDKYDVADINYDHSTIRVVDPGVKKGNCFSTPLYPCHITSLIHIIIRSNVTSSSSQAHLYALVGGKYMEVGDIKYSCTILRTIATRFLKHDNLSMSDLQEVLLLGLDLSFLSFRCKSECEVKGLNCDVNYSNHTVQCTKPRNFLKWFSLYIRSILGVDRFIEYFGYLSDGGVTTLLAGAVLIFQLMGNNIPLSWERLYKIALGVGRGIEYLHQGCDMQILHFDIKPHNILLDEDFTPKVSDFGLAKLYSTDESIVSVTAARGTLGYIAPELFYKNIGGVSFKADVYSFGMLLLAMVGKRKNVNAFARHSSQIYFPSWIYDRYDQGEDMEMGDATEDEKKYVRKMVIVALWCVQMKPVDRPSMSKTLEMLEGDIELLKMPPKPTLWSIENHEQSMVEVPISSSNSMGTISLNGR